MKKTQHFSSQLNQQELSRLRLVVGVVIAIAIAFGFNWPFAFIMPVLVAKFLSNNSPKLSIKKLIMLFAIIVAAIILAGIFTRLLLPFPVVFLLMTSLLIFWLSYWNNSGANEFIITMLLLAFTAIPALSLIEQHLAELFTINFLFSCFISLLITMVMHEIIPDHLPENTAIETNEIKLAAKPVRIKLALLSTLMIMPVMIVFLALQSNSLLILIFIALLAQKPDLVTGIKGSKALLAANIFGGIIAIALYNLLKIAPSFSFLLLLFTLTIAVFSRLIYSNRPAAPLYAMALGTVIILIASASASAGAADADEKFYTRIAQIACACAYIIFTTILANPILKKLSKN